MVDLYYLGYEGMQEIPWHKRLSLLLTPYATIDGMNEYGLVVSEMAVPRVPGTPDPEKVTILNSHVMRLLLDRAKTVDEAIALVRRYNVHFPVIGTHHLVADAQGNSAVIEYINGELVVTPNRDPWQVSTNFLICVDKPKDAKTQCWRYNTAYKVLSDVRGSMSQDEAMSLAKRTAQGHTVWSIVYNMTTGEIRLAMGRNYDRIHKFRLRMKNQ
jgi:predicted choloylglycine hydrolase